MKTTSTAIETPTTSLTTVSGSLTAMSAPKAEVATVRTPRGSGSSARSIRARANRAVADTVMEMTANMLVATACRGDIPTMIISGTLMSELPPVIAPSAPVATMRALRMAICPTVIWPLHSPMQPGGEVCPHAWRDTAVRIYFAFPP